MRTKGPWDYTRALLGVWWVFHFTRYMYFGNDDSGNSSVSEGDLFNQLEILSLAVLGLFHFKPAWRRLLAARDIWLTALILYVAWSFLTLGWSIDNELSVRRFALFLIELVAWIGLGAGYYGREGGPERLCRDVRSAGVILVILSLPIIGPELTLSNILNPYWESAIRLVGPHVIEASAFSLLACIAPTVSRKNTPAAAKLFLRPALIIMAFLLITKGRAPIAVTLLVCGFLWLRTIRSRRLRLAFRAILVVSVVFVVANVSTNSLQGTALGEFLSRGNDTHTLEGLNGRTQLWEYIISDIEQQPLRGYGFGAYWTSGRMETVWTRFRWHAPVAHNGYLDESVHTGLIGMGLILWFLFAVIFRLSRKQKRTPIVAIGCFWIFLFLLLNLTDSYFQNFRRIAVLLPMLMTFSCLALSAERRAAFRRMATSNSNDYFADIEPVSDGSVQVPTATEARRG